jgi:hypothetical protein
MKRNEPFNVLRDPNSWDKAPRDPATIAFAAANAAGLTTATTVAAFSATTFGMIATAAVSLGLSVATSAILTALTPAPPTPKQSLLVNSRDAAAPQDFVYGEVRKGGPITYLETTRGGSVLYEIIPLAAHEIESVEAIYINDEVATLSNDAYSNSRRSGAGWVTNRNWSDDPDEHEIRIFYHLGDQTSITDTFDNSTTESLDSVFFDTGSSDEDSQNFGGIGQPTKASFVGNGIAYLFVRFSYASGVFQNGIPVITAKIRGKKVFDPRTSTTAYSNNAALCIRDYLTSAYGLNDAQVDDTVFQAAANACDENVTLDAGGTENRYTLNGVVRANQNYGDVLQQMITSCAGTLFWGAGKWKLAVGEYNAPTKTLTLDDLRSNISLQTRVNLRDQFNRVQGVFNDADQRYIAADYPPIESATFLAEDDGVEQTLDLDLPFTTSSATAQRLAKMTLFRGREQMVFQAEFGMNAFDVEVGEIISLTISRYGWTNKEFEVVSWRFFIGSEGDMRVAMSLRETSSAAFSWTAEESALSANDSELILNRIFVLDETTTSTNADGEIIVKDGGVDTTQLNLSAATEGASDDASPSQLGTGINTPHRVSTVSITIPANETSRFLIQVFFEQGYPNFPTVDSWRYKIQPSIEETDGTFVANLTARERTVGMGAAADLAVVAFEDEYTNPTSNERVYVIDVDWYGEGSDIRLQRVTSSVSGFWR